MRIMERPTIHIYGSFNGELVLSQCNRLLEAPRAILPIVWHGGCCHSNFYPGGSQDMLFSGIPAGVFDQSEARSEDALYNSLG